jgi:hypothetical protein
MLTALWGLESDEPLASVHDALTERGAETLLLDQRRAAETRFHLDDESRLQGRLEYRNRSFRLQDIAAWYVRPYDTRRVPSVAAAGPQSPQWRHALDLEDSLLGWLEINPTRVLNRPATMLANGCKPYQLQLIARAGFDVPETLVTTDPAEVSAFRERHREIIYKSISGVRSRVTKLSASDGDHLDDVRHCPTQFQAYIPGTDYRVHVVGDSVFACEIHSAAVDYRHGMGGDGLIIRATRMPSDLEERALTMTRDMGLEVAGIDMRRTPEGQWYCFEVNPSPGFTFYEQFTGQGIAGAIADLMMSALDAVLQRSRAVPSGL